MIYSYYIFLKKREGKKERYKEKNPNHFQVTEITKAILFYSPENDILSKILRSLGHG